MRCWEGTLALSYHVKARFDLVYFGFQQSSRNTIRQHKIFFHKMACDLAPNCSFLIGYFSCNLPEHKIDVEVNCSHTKEHTCLLTFSVPQEEDDRLHGSETGHCQSLQRSFPNRPPPSPFAKWPNASPAKKRTMSAKPRKVKVRKYTPINWVGQKLPQCTW